MIAQLRSGARKRLIQVFVYSFLCCQEAESGFKKAREPQPVISRRPPIGVIAPRILMSVSARMYKEPLKIRMPTEKSLNAMVRANGERESTTSKTE